MFNTMVLKGGKIHCLAFNTRYIAVAGTMGAEAEDADVVTMGTVTMLSFKDGALLRHLQTPHTGQVNSFLLTNSL